MHNKKRNIVSEQDMGVEMSKPITLKATQ